LKVFTVPNVKSGVLSAIKELPAVTSGIPVEALISICPALFLV
jgi:hypothetical protein